MIAVAPTAISSHRNRPRTTTRRGRTRYHCCWTLRYQRCPRSPRVSSGGARFSVNVSMPTRDRVVRSMLNGGAGSHHWSRKTTTASGTRCTQRRTSRRPRNSTPSRRPLSWSFSRLRVTMKPPTTKNSVTDPPLKRLRTTGMPSRAERGHNVPLAWLSITSRIVMPRSPSRARIRVDGAASRATSVSGDVLGDAVTALLAAASERQRETGEQEGDADDQRDERHDAGHQVELEDVRVGVV